MVDKSRENSLRRSANKKYYRDDFSGLDLANADFRNATCIECQFVGTDLTYANFENANCWGSNFTDSILYRTNFKDATLAKAKMSPKDCFGMTITLSCDTVDGMELNEKFWSYWLYMISRCKVLVDEKGQSSVDKIVYLLGAEKYAKISRVFGIRTG